jgi:Uma2 family endonuclease
MSLRVRRPPASGFWTVHDLPDAPESAERLEVLHGELLVTPIPSSVHQRVAVDLAFSLTLWCRERDGWDVRAPARIRVGETTQLEPDLALFPVRRLSNASWLELPIPALVIEILSPRTRRIDRFRKRPVYLAHGVREVWLVDTEARTIEQWKRSSEIAEVHSAWVEMTVEPLAAPLRVSVAGLFGPVLSAD